jgi:hypothetical protein
MAEGRPERNGVDMGNLKLAVLELGGGLASRSMADGSGRCYPVAIYNRTIAKAEKVAAQFKVQGLW